MHTAPPKLTRHATGQYRARWNGRDFYFGSDAAKARDLFLLPTSDHPGSLVRWQDWRESRRRRSTTSAPLTVAEFIKLFLEHYFDAGRPDTEEYYRHHLRRFVRVFGMERLRDVTPADVNNLASDLAGMKLSAKTINHDINAIKTAFRWGSRPVRNLCSPLNLDGIEVPPLRKGVPEPMRPREIKAAIARASAVYPELGPWMRLNYLAALRPSEVVRLAGGEGILCDIPPEHDGRRQHRAVKEGQVLLRDHKMVRSNDQDRIIPLSAEALRAFKQLCPLPVQFVKRRSRPARVRDLQKRYALLLRRAGVPAVAHRLRDSAASHLRAAGVDQEVVNQVLGHSDRSELANYGRASVRLLRATAAQLTLR